MRALIIIAMIALVSACGTPVEGESGERAASPSVTRISAIALRELVVHPELSAQAQVTSRNISRLSAEITARIEALPVEPGQRIPAGETVAQLDCRDARILLRQVQAELATTQARLRLAEQQLKRNEDLAQKNFVSGDTLEQRRTEVDVIRAEREVAQARVEAARYDVSKCVIVSPFDAVVEARLAYVGELTAPGTPLLTLWDMNGLEVVADVQQKDADSLANATAVTLVTPAATYALRLVRISPAQDTAARTREARLAFIDTLAPPGAAGRIQWHSAEPYLPAEYVLRRDGRYGVFVAENGAARFVPLAAAQEGRPVAIELPLDTQVIADGRFALTDGQAVGVGETRPIPAPVQ